jgi:hypothetical protein
VLVGPVDSACRAAIAYPGDSQIAHTLGQVAAVLGGSALPDNSAVGNTGNTGTAVTGNSVDPANTGSAAAGSSESAGTAANGSAGPPTVGSGPCPSGQSRYGSTVCVDTINCGPGYRTTSAGLCVAQPQDVAPQLKDAAMCTAAGLGEGSSDVPFTARGVTCAAGAQVLKVVIANIESSRCGVATASANGQSCVVDAFRCGDQGAGPATPGTPIVCAEGGEAVRFELPG